MPATPAIIRRQAAADSELPDDFPPLLKRVLAHRAITRNEQLDHSLSRLLDPFLMKDMHKAVARLVQALQHGQQIIIVGDYDADGATSTAMMVLALESMGFERVSFVVPDRFEYGYGLSPAIVDSLAFQRPDLLVTVDNGISSIAGVERANALGMDVIVTDHHLPGDALPAACAIVNPNQPGCESQARSLAGVGVAFHLLVALRKTLREQDWFAQKQIAEPNLADYLDLVALGTVADVVPLDFYNRVLVSQGIRRMQRDAMRPGLRQLLQVAGKNPRLLSSSDLGFALGPRLNAAGRLDDMSQGIMLLMTGSEELAAELARSLDELNRDRRQIEQQMQHEALQIVDHLGIEDSNLPRAYCLYHPEWHQGVVGLVASRLKEKFHRPVIAFARAEEGLLKGSGRSINGVHMRDTLDRVAACQPGLLEKFGGHAMAAGLTLEEDKLPLFEQSFLSVLAECDAALFEPVIESDGELHASDLTLYSASLLRDVVPWGQQMPEPCFDGIFVVCRSRVLKERHLKLTVSPVDAPATQLDAIWFNADDYWCCNPLPSHVQLVYRLQVNEFRGEMNLQLMVDDCREVHVA